MKKAITLYAILLALLPLLLNAQSRTFWTKNEVAHESIVSQHGWAPTAYKSMSLDLNAMKGILLTAPHFQAAGAVPVTVELPMPDGSFESFSILEIPVMHPDLQKKFPGMRTFGGNGIEHPLWSVRCDFTQFGFHGYVTTEKGTAIINPLSLKNTNDYLVYYKHQSGRKPTLVCELNDENLEKEIRKNIQGITANRSTNNQLRTYRLAMAATGEYTAFYGGTVAGGLAGIVTSVNRVDGIYMREVDVHFVLIPNNNLLVYTNAATDPYTNNSGGTMLGENQNNITTVIGTANFDVGHVFSTGGGGVASLGVICSASNKARGVTGLSAPVGDPFDVDYVAHEIGHQFAGNHTFNSVTGSCNGNRSGSHAYEVGSGITIQAYAGICGSDDLAPHSIAYFHTHSFDEIYDHVTIGNGSTCPVITPPPNSAPVINTITGTYNIPYLTAFKLTATGSDPDVEPIDYSWEQFDLGPAGAWNAPSGNAPIYRSYAPSVSGERIFPKLSNILSNTISSGEIYPTYARSLQFRVTLRDEKNTGGGVTYNDTPVLLQVINVGDTFKLTYPNVAGIVFTQNTCPTIKWKVAGTNVPPISVASVNILLSTDGGNTFPYTLASGVPNTGSYTVTLPSGVTTATGRIMVEAQGNIFFDINDFNFTISSSLVVSGVTSPNGSCSGAPTGVIDLAGNCAGTPFTYLWNTAATTEDLTGLAAGTYTVTVTDNLSATATASFTVDNAAGSVAVIATGTNTSCAPNSDGTATATNVGGLAPFNYLWSNSQTTQTATGLAAGVYTVTITDGNSCTATASVTIAIGSISVTASGTNTTCAQNIDGTAAVTTSTGTPPISYLWSNSQTTQAATGLASGTYTVTITDGNNCTATASVTIAAGISPSSPTTGNYSICQGAAVPGGQGLTASAPLIGPLTNQNKFSGSPFSSLGSSPTIVSTISIPALPSGAVITSAQLKLFKVNSINGSWRSEFRVALSGAYTLAATQVSALNSGGIVSPDPVINLTGFPSSGGAVNLVFSETFDDSGIDATVDSVRIDITYTITPTVSWWDSPSGGTQVGTGSPFDPIGTVPLPNSNTPGNYTFYAESNANGCGSISRAPAIFVINAAPSPSISGTLVFCAGGSSTLDAGNGYSSYNWSTGATTQSISVNTSGTFTVTVTDANGCTGSASVTTTVNASPTPSISGSLAICSGSSTILDAGIYAGYSWSTGETTQTISVNTTGTFTVTVTDVNGCTGSTSATTTVGSLNPSISGTLAFCAGGSTNLDAGAGYNNYNWSTGETTQSITVSTAGTFTIIVSDLLGCTGSASVTTTVNATPTPAITGTLTFCSGSSTTLDAGAGYSGYNWSTGETTQTISVNTAGTFTVTVTDGNGCNGSASVTTTANASPTPSISGALAFCSGGSTTLDAGSGFSSYLWSTGATTQTISVNTAGTFAVTVTDGNGCTGSTSVTTTVNPNPTPAITGTLNFCAGGSSTLDAGSGFSSYLWSTGATTQSISASTAETFTVTVTNTNGCTGSTSATTTVNANPTPVITGGSLPCNGSSTTLDAGLYSSYIWSTGATTQTIFVSTAGTFTVTVSNAGGCTGSASKVVSYAGNPPAKPATMIGSFTANCLLLNMVYSCSSVANATSYFWTVPVGVKIISGQGTTSITVNYTPAFNNKGVISVAAVNACGMSAALKRNTTARLSSPVISGPNSMCTGDIKTYTVAAVPGALSYTWTKVAGSTILSGQGTTTVTILWGNVGGLIKCSANNACGGSINGVYSVSKVCNNRLADSGIDFTEIKLYPNPASTSATLQFDALAEGKGLISVYDIVGQQVLSKPINVLSGENQFVLDLNTFPKGIYNVHVDYNGMVRNKKLVIQ